MQLWSRSSRIIVWFSSLLNLALTACVLSNSYLDICGCDNAYVDDAIAVRSASTESPNCTVTFMTGSGQGLTVTTGVVFNIGDCGRTCDRKSYIQISDGISEECICERTEESAQHLFSTDLSTLTISIGKSLAALSVQALGCAHDDLISPDGVESISTIQGSPKIPGSYTVKVTCSSGYAVGGTHQWIDKECVRDVASPVGSWNSDQLLECTRVQCASPAAVINAVISPHSYSYQLENTVEFHCQMGYRLISGSSSRTCLFSHGRGPYWSGSAAECQKVTCEVPGISAAVYNRSRTMDYGSTLIISCENGYNLIGSSLMTCQANGTWSQFPRCQSVKCLTTLNIQHSIPQFSCSHNIRVNDYGCNITFTCQPGYQLVGPETTVCEANGQWTSLPTCEERSCGPLPTVAHAACFECDGSDGVNATKQYKCNEGYELTTSHNNIKCTNDGKWSAPPQCEIVDCGVLPPVTNGRWRALPGFTKFNAVIYLVCDYGYLAHGADSTVCRSNGNWSVGASCQEVDCGEITKSEHHVILQSDYSRLISSQVSFNCTRGYEMLNDTNYITCQGNGTWSTLPTCEVKKCPTPLNMSVTNGVHEVIYDTKYIYGDKISYKCNSGYNTEHGDYITCTEYGTWSELPVCKKTECGDPEQLPSGKIIQVNKTNSEVTVTYQCANNLTIVTASCNEQGIWSYPSCIIDPSATEQGDAPIHIYISVSVGVVVFVLFIILSVGCHFKMRERKRRSRIALTGSQSSAETNESQKFLPRSFPNRYNDNPSRDVTYNTEQCQPQGSPPGPYSLPRNRNPISSDDIYRKIKLADDREWIGDEFLSGSVPLYAEKRQDRDLPSKSSSPTHYEPMTDSEPRTPEPTRANHMSPQIVHSNNYVPKSYPLARTSLELPPPPPPHGVIQNPAYLYANPQLISPINNKY